MTHFMDPSAFQEPSWHRDGLPMSCISIRLTYFLVLTTCRSMLLLLCSSAETRQYRKKSQWEGKANAGWLGCYMGWVHTYTCQRQQLKMTVWEAETRGVIEEEGKSQNIESQRVTKPSNHNTKDQFCLLTVHCNT